MFHRKLTALNYSVEKFNINDDSQFRNLVLWLEDQKVRHYPIKDRKALRDIQDSNWPNAFQQYLKDVSCPINSSNQKAVLDWLLGLAVRLEYGDNVDKYKDATSNVKSANVPRVVQANPLDNLDFESTEFKQGVSSLAKVLNINQHPDHLVTLKAICIFVKERLTPETIAAIKDRAECKPFPLKESSLGFDAGDRILNDAAKILRMLYIHDLRDLQTRINETIVAVQSITANPKTDTRLGKVGR